MRSLDGRHLARPWVAAFDLNPFPVTPGKVNCLQLETVGVCEEDCIVVGSFTHRVTSAAERPGVERPAGRDAGPERVVRRPVRSNAWTGPRFAVLAYYPVRLSLACWAVRHVGYSSNQHLGFRAAAGRGAMGGKVSLYSTRTVRGCLTSRAPSLDRVRLGTE